MEIARLIQTVEEEHGSGVAQVMQKYVDGLQPDRLSYREFLNKLDEVVEADRGSSGRHHMSRTTSYPLKPLPKRR